MPLFKIVELQKAIIEVTSYVKADIEEEAYYKVLDGDIEDSIENIEEIKERVTISTTELEDED